MATIGNTPDHLATACYQRQKVLEKYIQSVKRLIDLEFISALSDVLPDLLESLEQEKSQMSEVHEALALRYRQEPYRSCHVLKRWKTRAIAMLASITTICKTEIPESNSNRFTSLGQSF